MKDIAAPEYGLKTPQGLWYVATYHKAVLLQRNSRSAPPPAFGGTVPTGMHGIRCIADPGTSDWKSFALEISSYLQRPSIGWRQSAFRTGGASALAAGNSLVGEE
ncbi:MULTISPECIES: hypothetical protein [unclassified Sphingomonas]|uniref:hypothetical protein n=1 Tax=unclassified Sphingomonas TaxID=196159 RepID=UPI00138F84A4|nr:MULTISPECIES: hypothetical protein [unclassified Sphingomonas]